MQWDKNQWWKPRTEQEQAIKSKEDIEIDTDNLSAEPEQRKANQDLDPRTKKTIDTNLKQTMRLGLDKQIGSAEQRTHSQGGCDDVTNRGLAGDEQDVPEPSREGENLWVAETMVKEIAQNHTEKKTQKLPDAEETTGRKKRKRKGAGRTNQVMTRLTDSELVTLQRRISKSGLAQGEYLRNAALYGQIVIAEHSVADVALLDELALIRAELGRQGGLLKMIIKPNEGRRELAPEEWSKLIEWIRNVEKTKKRLTDLEAKVLRGHNET